MPSALGNPLGRPLGGGPLGGIGIQGGPPSSGGTSTYPIVQLIPFITGAAAGSLIVPPGVNYCEAIAIGPGGGGGDCVGTGSQGGCGGGGASGRSRFPVTPGQSVSYSATTSFGSAGSNGSGGGNGTPTTVTYNGVVVAQGDCGYGGAYSSNGSVGSQGSGGLPSNCVGNVEIRAGQSGQILTSTSYRGGFPGVASLGTPILPASAPVHTISAGSTAQPALIASTLGAGGMAGYSGTGNQLNGAAGGAGGVQIIFTTG